MRHAAVRSAPDTRCGPRRGEAASGDSDGVQQVVGGGGGEPVQRLCRHSRPRRSAAPRTVSRVGILPFEAEMNLPAGVGFSIHDGALVITETWHAEMWLDDPEDVALHMRAWETLDRNAAYGTAAHRLITRAKRSLGA